MRVQRTRTQQLRAPLTTTLASEKYAVQFQLMFVQLLIGLYSIYIVL